MPGYFCYLLRSLKTKRSTATYIGFTTKPERRIRQHNGEIKSGAKRTIKSRPWEFCCIISGFPNKRVALKFEYMWTYPQKSRMTKKVFPSRMVGWKRRLKVLGYLVDLPVWSQLHLTCNFSKEEYQTHFTENENCVVKSSLLSDIVDVHKERMGGGSGRLSRVGESCSVCSSSSSSSSSNFNETIRPQWTCPTCSSSTHLTCLATHSLSISSSSSSSLIPSRAVCPTCSFSLDWIHVVRATLQTESDLEESVDDEENDDSSSFSDSSLASEEEEDEIFDLTQEEN